AEDGKATQAYRSQSASHPQERRHQVTRSVEGGRRGRVRTFCRSQIDVLADVRPGPPASEYSIGFPQAVGLTSLASRKAFLKHDSRRESCNRSALCLRCSRLLAWRP